MILRMRSNASKCKSVYRGATGAVPPPRPVRSCPTPKNSRAITLFKSKTWRVLKKFNLLFFMLVVLRRDKVVLVSWTVCVPLKYPRCQMLWFYGSNFIPPPDIFLYTPLGKCRLFEIDTINMSLIPLIRNEQSSQTNIECANKFKA